MKNKLKITNPYGPNTTVLLPGRCNSRCGFCFWNRTHGEIKPPSTYLDDVFSVLEDLPSDFMTLSISGGEPTLSPLFGKFLARLGAHRRKNFLGRVVLTTSGENIQPFITAAGCVIDHINISRHGLNTEENQRIFNNGSIPSDEQLRDIILKIHSEANIDVNLSCVVADDVTELFCRKYISYAKNIGADSVSFRKVASDVSPTEAEEKFVSRYGVVVNSNCPVCRGVVQYVDGYEVRWKGSVLEPSIEMGGIYEAIIHPDGELYRDWGMKHPIYGLIAEESEDEHNLCASERQRVSLGPPPAGCGISAPGC